MPRTVLVALVASFLSACSSEGGSPAGHGGWGGATAAGSGGAPEGLAGSCSAGCDSVTPSPPVLTEDGALGNVTMYSTSPSSGGACQYGKTGVAYYAAPQVNLEPGDGLGQWQAGRRCGDCARVTVLTSAGQRQVVVRIMDKCPDGDCGLDLGGDAPEAVMADGFGRYAGGWEFIPCTGHPEVFDGPPSLFVKEGSNAWWSAVQVRNPNLAVAALHWSGPEGTGDFDYQGAELENYYLVPAALLQSSAEVKITVEYRDASTQTVSLAGSELAVEGALYPLQG